MGARVVGEIGETGELGGWANLGEVGAKGDLEGYIGEWDVGEMGDLGEKGETMGVGWGEGSSV